MQASIARLWQVRFRVEAVPRSGFGCSPYDAWAAYDEKAIGTRLGGTLRRPAAERTVANKEKAIAFATYRALLDVYPDDAAWLASKGVVELPAGEWNPYSPATFVTPPFPGFPSGHSTVSAASARMLERFTGRSRLTRHPRLERSAK